MGAKCCGCHKGKAESDLTLADLEVQATDLNEMIAEETRVVAVDVGYEASNILWTTRSFSDKIPDGFYVVIPDDRLKNLSSIPTFDELRWLADRDIRPGVILVDSKEDEKLVRYTNLMASQAQRLDPNPVDAISQVAGLVNRLFGVLGSPPEDRVMPLVGQMKYDSCRARALLFKVLVDKVGLESRIVVGFPGDLEPPESIEPYNHMSVVVKLGNVEMVVDLTDIPGRLIPLTSDDIFKVHMLTTKPCVSPLTPSSGMFGSGGDGDDQGNTTQARGGLKSVFHPGASSSQGGPSKAYELPPPTPSSGTSRGGRSIAYELPLPTASFWAVRAKREPLELSRFSKEKVVVVADDISPPSPNERTEESSGIRNNVSSLPLLPYEEWEIDYSEIELKKTIGNGNFGVVRKGIWNGTEVAVKILYKKDLTAESLEDFRNELSILSRLRHPNVVLFLGASTIPPNLSIVTELMATENLYNVIHSIKHIVKLANWDHKIKIMRDICKGLMYIHRMGIVHRDLKSANCLLSKHWNVKICDFGLSILMKDVGTKPTLSAGTPEWMAPELIKKDPFTEKCDIFSFGVVMWEIATLDTPWEGVEKHNVVNSVANNGGRLEIPECPVKDLIADCWLEPPERRPSCEDIMSQLMLLGQCTESVSLRQ